MFCQEFCFYLKRCATTAGPYQSPAVFPDFLPYSISQCKPKLASGESPNQDMIFRWYCSSTLSSLSRMCIGLLGWFDWFLNSLSPISDVSRDAVSFFTVWVVHDSDSGFSKTKALAQVQSVIGLKTYYIIG